ncbi:MAG: (deoxy)nucleoside triphosphate pyrophosphohydrolase [Alphaproteobacteria bacterium]|nr:(deoxy)nucleoside triphosphate pyrophosphohydrolase [Alphaproteobacteria bacterium]
MVGAVALRGQEVFMARRPPGGRHGGLWEFPGGKVEAGESDQEALRRELMEELGVPVEVGPLIAVGHDETIELHCYQVRLGGAPVPREGQELRWFSRAELPLLTTPPADTPAIRALVGGTKDLQL